MPEGQRRRGAGKEPSGGPHERLGPALAAEHPARDHGVAADFQRWLLAAGPWSRRRKRKPHRSRRQRKARFGERMQLGGSYHDRLEGGGSNGEGNSRKDDLLHH